MDGICFILLNMYLTAGFLSFIRCFHVSCIMMLVFAGLRYVSNVKFKSPLNTSCPENVGFRCFPLPFSIPVRYVVIVQNLFCGCLFLIVNYNVINTYSHKLHFHSHSSFNIAPNNSVLL